MRVSSITLIIHINCEKQKFPMLDITQFCIILNNIILGIRSTLIDAQHRKPALRDF